MAIAMRTGWSKIIAISTLAIIWLLWSLNLLRPDITRTDVLSKLPSFETGATTSLQDPQDDLRPLILYTYAESENARTNLKFFLQMGLHGQADFIFIFNGETDAHELIPNAPNIRVVLRENKCFDIGAHGEILRTDDLWKNYKRFIMMNASIRGPFAPTYYPTCWMDAFLGKLTDKVKVSDLQRSCKPMLVGADSTNLHVC